MLVCKGRPRVLRRAPRPGRLRQIPKSAQALEFFRCWNVVQAEGSKISLSKLFQEPINSGPWSCQPRLIRPLLCCNVVCQPLNIVGWLLNPKNIDILELASHIEPVQDVITNYHRTPLELVLGHNAQCTKLQIAFRIRFVLQKHDTWRVVDVNSRSVGYLVMHQMQRCARKRPRGCRSSGNTMHQLVARLAVLGRRKSKLLH
mmetsp:Transcript_96063/g.256691  ORF Transcript_96063/g.256691 Transcript_96063/m.256691 type:complete len:202 (-) Transcript_96063:526-1131(-)